MTASTIILGALVALCAAAVIGVSARLDTLRRELCWQATVLKTAVEAIKWLEARVRRLSDEDEPPKQED
ncbi:MAG: hypothetical protein LUC33_03065 [Prevotellaceae bacterium]|nr:hypothetical protein [Prevotellaceae bacterium]